ncbi:hypothetical protein EVAR_35997_1 [Eumeta japonica]|uniref:Uncharacterized protein n=1 Tax=Eumeta variegata TaxID=151549 RepID=A0A4C1WU93_EUMVA|nr:hypothetical protein EVAR_35997_1 [Eumeta japonica]
MSVSVCFETEEVMDRSGCIKSSEVHDVIARHPGASHNHNKRESVRFRTSPTTHNRRRDSGIGREQAESSQRKFRISRTLSCIHEGTKKNRKTLARGEIEISTGSKYILSKEGKANNANKSKTTPTRDQKEDVDPPIPVPVRVYKTTTLTGHCSMHEGCIGRANPGDSKTVTIRIAFGDARQDWVVPDIEWNNRVSENKIKD